MNYAVMPIADYVGACDSIREKTGKTDPIKSGELAEQVGKIYESGKEEGQSSMIDPTKIIEKTASGIGSVTVDDVSEIPHEISVQLSSDTITDFSGVNITVCGDSLYTGEFERGSFSPQTGGVSPSEYRVRSIAYTPLNSGTYTLLTDEGKNLVVYVYDEKETFMSKESYVTWSSTNALSFTLTDTRLIKFAIRKSDDSKLVISDVKFLLLYGEENAKTYNSTVDGVVGGVTSLSPNMILLSDNESVSISMTYHKSWGMQTEWDRFWDAYQKNGTKESYYYTFADWKKPNFKPKYDIVPIKCQGTFQYLFDEDGEPVDFVELLDELGINLDFSKVYGINQYTFSNANISHLGVLDFSGAVTSLAWLMEYTPIVKVEKLIIPSNGKCAFDNAFRGMPELEEIYFEGVIGVNVSFSASTKLKKSSIQNIIGVLSDATTSQKLTLSLTAVNTAFETSSGTADGSTSEEWLNLVATKPNWTISLA